MQQGLASPAAIRHCEGHGAQVVHDECLLIFAEPARFIHRAHRWVWGLLGDPPLRRAGEVPRGRERRRAADVRYSSHAEAPKMRRACVAAMAFAALALTLPSRGDIRILKLKCVNKIGDNMYRAKDKTVVWTEHCSREAKCEDVEVRLGDDARITWSDGSYCWVLKVAER
jgi:hypothetical protein